MASAARSSGRRRARGAGQRKASREASLVRDLDEGLRGAADAERAVNEKAYLKSPIDHYGVTVPGVRRALKAVARSYGELSHGELMNTVERLWSSSVHEQRMAAVMLLELRCDDLEPKDLPVIEDMIRGSFTWAYVDNLAARVVGPLVEHHPELADELDRWAHDESFWLRRASMLALLEGLRRGEGDWERFTRYADTMLDETEFFVRKAIGWVLRETSKKRPDLVHRYVASRLERLSGVSFREAVRRLPERYRTRLEKAYRSRHR